MIDDISGPPPGELIGWGLLISAVVIGVRLLWQFTVVYLIRAIDRREVQRAAPGGLAERLVVGWAGHARVGVAGRRAGAAADHRRRRRRSPTAT